jgi:maltose O-acetyltransferase
MRARKLLSIFMTGGVGDANEESRASSTGGGGGIAARLRAGARLLRVDLRKLSFDLLANVLLASPVVPRVVRASLLRATGMQLATYNIYPRCSFGSSQLRVGRRTQIGYGVQFDNGALIEVGDNVGIGMRVTFVTSAHDIGPSECRAAEPNYFRPITVGNGAWIGAGAMILGGITIGEGCVIAAGSVVTKNCAPDTLYAGVPARPIRELESAPPPIRELASAPPPIRELASAPPKIRELASDPPPIELAA